MKKISLAFLTASFTSGSTFAQSDVHLYGIVDTSIRYISSDNAAGGRNIKMDNGALTNSRWGLKGSEDIGGGSKVNVLLESGFNSDDGSFSSAGILFNRQAIVGVSGSYGRVDVGRQPSALFDLLSDHFDPLTVANYDLTSWLPVGAGLGNRVNVVKYYGKFDGLAAGISYAPGEQAGAARSGSQISATLQYTSGALSIGGACQQTWEADNTNRRHQVCNLNASYVVDAFKLFGGYFNIKDNTGITTAYFGATNSAASASGGVAGITRKDDAGFLGATYTWNPAWALTVAAYVDKSRNVAVSPAANPGNGRRYALVGVAEYSLSRRTQVYGTLDHNNAHGASRAELAGKDNVTGLSLGIRHLF